LKSIKKGLKDKEKIVLFTNYLLLLKERLMAVGPKKGGEINHIGEYNQKRCPITTEEKLLKYLKKRRGVLSLSHRGRKERKGERKGGRAVHTESQKWIKMGRDRTRKVRPEEGPLCWEYTVSVQDVIAS